MRGIAFVFAETTCVVNVFTKVIQNWKVGTINVKPTETKITLHPLGSFALDVRFATDLVDVGSLLV